MEREMIFVSWEDFDNMVSQLFEQIKDSGNEYSGVYGIPRGGLTLAVCLSHRLKIPLIFNECEVEGSVLVVDDISDSGTQLFKWLEYGNDIATLHWTSGTKSLPKYTVEQKLRDDIWIVYPWECRGDDFYEK